MSEYVDGLELLRWERRIADLTAAALKRYLKVAEAAVLPSLTAALGPIPPDPDALASTAAQWQAILRESVLPGVEAMMAERVVGLAPEAARAAEAATVAGLYEKSTRAAARAYAIPTTREWMETYLVAVENRMVRTPDTAFRLVASEVDKATAAGESIDVMRHRVQGVLDYTGNSDWPGRAQLVARSETTAAYNGAGLEAARLESTATGKRLEKVWVCVHPDSVVLSDEALAVARRPYDGQMVTLRTAGDAALTVTPEHKVLTRDRGWVRADQVDETDHLFHVGWGHSVGGPHVEDEPSSISEVAGPRFDVSATEQVRPVLGGVDLHVDSADGEVEVVGADGELRRRFQPRTAHSSGEVEFMLPDVGRGALFGSRSSRKGLGGDGDAPAGLPRLGVSGRLGLGSLAGGAEPSGGAVVADRGVGLAEHPAHRRAGASEFDGDSPSGQAGLVEAQRVIGIEVGSFSGHVYDLQTVGEWFTCDSILVHNCTIDGATRDTHFEADGQRVPLDQPFDIGGADLMFPGDPDGPVEEVANCRCTMVELEPEDALPSENDRQTERSDTDSVVKRRDGRSQREEVDRRAGDGVRRARDDDDGSLRASAMGDTMTRTWTGRLAPIGEPSGDGRIFKPGGTYGFRTFPLPLMFQRQTSDGHDASVIVGAIRAGEVREDGIYGEGVLFASADAAEAATLLEEGVVRPSIDWCDQEWELADRDGNPVDPETIDPETIDEVMFQITAGNLMGATLVSKPAFDGTDVTLAEEGAAEAPEEGAPEEEASVSDDLTEDDVREALVASGGGLAPTFDRSMFENPGLAEPTGVHVTPEGRVLGHVATWNECHIGVGNACVMAPRSKTNYALFHVSEVDTTDGPLAVGRLTVGGGHAHPKAGVVPAREHYDNAGACWAVGRVYEDEVGIVFSGVVHPHATPRQIMDGTSAPLSGDWRRHGGNLEMVAALTVNTPGYPVVRGAADDRGRDVSLVAAGMLQPKEREEQRPITEIVAEAARAAVEEYANRERRIERVATIHERIANERMAKAARIASRRVEIGAR